MLRRSFCLFSLLADLILPFSATHAFRSIPLQPPVLFTTESSPRGQNAPAAWQMIGQIGGPTEAVAAQGNYAYLGVGLRLEVVDISDMANPHPVSSTAPFPYFVEAIAVRGTWAFVAAGEAGMRVVDLSSPAHPSEVGAWDSPGYAKGVAVAGSYVFLADGPYGLRILDISNPAHPTPVSSAFPTQHIFGVTVAGKFAYLAAGGAGVLIVDVSNPLYPVELGSIEIPGYASRIAVTQTKAYVADGWDGLWIIDITDPTQPKAIGHAQTPGQAFGVSISGNRAYVADAWDGLRILDISNPSQPLDLGGYAVVKGHAGDLAIIGNTALVADANCGLFILDITNPAIPAKLASYTPFGMAKAIAVSGVYGYIAAGDDGIHVVSLTDPAHPVEVSAFVTRYPIKCIAVEGNYAYAASDYGEEFYVLDISDPTHIRLVGSDQRQGEGAYQNIVVTGGFAYLANEYGLVIIDLSDPAHPHRVGDMRLKDPPGGEILSATKDIAVKNGLAYLTAENGGIKIVDVSQAANPTLIGSFSLSMANAVAIVGNLAYVAGGSGLTVVDVTDPHNPVSGVSMTTAAMVEGVDVLDNTLYLSVGSIGVETLDLSNPSSPTLMSVNNTPGYAQSVAFGPSYVYVADEDGGIAVWQKTTALQVLPAFRPHPLLASSPVDFPISLAATTVESQSLQPHTISQAAASTCLVTSIADIGAGTLRNCLTIAQSGTTIQFDLAVFPPTHPQTIQVASELPKLSQSQVTIDASNAGVILDGSIASAGSDGLSINSSWNTIKGLQILHFPGNGIFIWGGATHNQIGGDRTQGSGPLGGGNLISGNRGFAGVEINSPGTNYNVLTGNQIGTDLAGNAAFPNLGFGVFIGTRGNRIGGEKPGEGNVISANGMYGIEMLGFDASQNIVVGNYIGLDLSGSQVLGNGDIGVGMEMGANANSIEKNVIVTTNRNAVLMNDPGSSYNTVVGNLIGTNASGTAALGGGFNGVSIGMGAAFNRIGGKTIEDRNVIVGGIGVFRNAGIGNLILGNYIGTDRTGTTGFNIRSSGIIVDSSRLVFIGGNTTEEGNLISGNAFGGIKISPGSDDVFIARNSIGPDASGTKPIGNEMGGITLYSAEHIFIQKNTIAFNNLFNTSTAIQVNATGPNPIRQNTIYGNRFGIQNVNGGNEMLTAPVITLTSNGLTGIACPGCTVELFLDASDEGQLYLGSATANANGTFSYPKICPVTLPNLTATATDPKGNTSQFSSPQSVPWDCSASNPIPTLTSANPPFTMAGGNTFILTLTGSGFVNSSVVKWNGANLLTSTASSTQLMAVVPSTALIAGGTIHITVSSPAPGGGSSNQLDFTVYNPVPIISSINPTSITAGSNGFSLTVNGTGFVAGSVVKGNGISLATTYFNDTQLLVSIPTNTLTSPKDLLITVFNPDPGGGLSNTTIFSILFSKTFLPFLIR